VKRVAVFASGGGSNFRALLDHQAAGDLDVEFVLLVGNNSRAGAFEHARARGIPSLHLAPSHFDDYAEYTRRLMAALDERKVDIIALAGYMKKLPPEVVTRYRHRILNIHPALLPAFGGKGMYGGHVHRAVIESGVKLTGVTVHLVDEEYDDGPIVVQEPVAVLDADTSESLAARVLTVEHATYWRAVKALADDAVRVEGRRVLGNA
jgi:phosphoribosylglycinamide formyltransferase 1